MWNLATSFDRLPPIFRGVDAVAVVQIGDRQPGKEESNPAELVEVEV